jgi:hypothetical protein
VALMEQFKSTLVYQAVAPVREHLQMVESIGQLDRESEKRRLPWLLLGLGAIIGGVVLLVLSGQLLLLAPLGVLSIVGGVLAILKCLKVNRTDVEDRRYRLLGGLLGLIGQDIRPEQPVSVRLDLRPVSDPAKLVSQGKAGELDVKQYVDPWLSVNGKLADGTSFRLGMIERLRTRSGWAAGRSGKRKYKSRKKQAHVASLFLKSKASHPGLASLAQSSAQAIVLPPGARVAAFRATDDSVLLKAVAPDWKADELVSSATGLSGPHLLAMMFVSLYQLVNQTHAARPASTSGPLS